MESKRADEIKNLLLKIIIPLAFPLAGSFICGLITDRTTNRHSDLESSDSSIQLDQSLSYGSSSTRGEEEEEEAEGMESSNRASRKLVQAEIPCSTGRLLGGGHARHASLTEEIMVAQATESSSEVSVNNQRFQDDHGRTEAGVEEEDVETLKRAVATLEQRAAGIESRFNDYCDMKEQESTYQKMQIMCLGMKLELLESQNQRLDAAAAEVRAAAAEFAAMRAKLDALQREFKKMSRKSRQEFEAIDGRILALDAQEAEMARRCQGFEQHIEEMKQLTLQLQEEKGTNNENVEIIVERSMRKLSSSKDLLDGLEALRDRWAADMEELIYLGWITAWLQHDLLVSDGGEAGGGSGAKGTVAIVADVDDEDGLTAAEQKKKGEKMVAAAAPTSEVELCRASSSEPGKEEEEEEEESCMGRAGCRTGIGRPRLLRRLRGWARGKDAASKSRGPCRIQGP